MELVTIENVGKNYRLGEVDVAALEGVSLSVGQSAFVTLVGPSGSDKTALLKLIGCLDKPSLGRVMVAGQDTSRLNRRLAASGFGA